MKRRSLAGSATLTLALLCSALASGQEPQSPALGLPGSAQDILGRADALLGPPGRTCELLLEVAVSGGPSLSYRLRSWIRDDSAQRAEFLDPAFDAGDLALRTGEIARFRHHGWPRFDTMNARSSFLDSPFSWIDALYPGIGRGYVASSAAWAELGGERLIRLDLKALGPGGYRRIEVWIRPGSYQTVQRVYYSPSGTAWKVARFADYSMAAGVATGWTMAMEDTQTGLRASIRILSTGRAAMPDAYFGPAGLLKE